MRTCKACGCYIPDLWSECPACGRALQDGGNLENVGTTVFEIIGSMWERERWRDALSCSMPKTVLRFQYGKSEDLELLDEPDMEIIWISDPNVEPYPIELEPSDRELSKIPKPSPMPTVFTH